MKLWDKGEVTDKQITEFTVGSDRDYDLLLAPYDCQASQAHAKMLHRIGILTDQEKDKVLNELKKIADSIEADSFTIEDKFEDIHSKIEYLLTERLGDLGKKIHTGRSRNDQVLVALQLMLKDKLHVLVSPLNNLFDLLIQLADQYRDILMPGYTHMQIAMPSSFGLWFAAYAECLIDDMRYLMLAREHVDQNPLGTAAGFGTSFAVDREFTTKELKFAELKVNPIASQIGRSKIDIVFLNALGSIAFTLGKLSYDICLYMGQEFGFIEFDQSITTGSSIMPHKKNPDVFELVRAKCNKVRGRILELQLIHSNLPSGYHRDIQLTKEIVIESYTELYQCIKIIVHSLPKIIINKDVINSPIYDQLFTVNTLEEWVKKGMPFRDAYKKMAELIKKEKFVPNKILEHTHVGSIGNLGLDILKKKMDEVLLATRNSC